MIIKKSIKSAIKESGLVNSINYLQRFALEDNVVYYLLTVDMSDPPSSVFLGFIVTVKHVIACVMAINKPFQNCLLVLSSERYKVTLVTH